MKIKAFAIEKFASFILSGRVFYAIKEIVLSLNDEKLSGEQKRHQAVKLIGSLGYGLAAWLVNLGIELAVAWAKERADAG